MEDEFVTISVKRHDELRELEKEIKNGKRLCVNSSVNVMGLKVKANNYYYTDSEIVEKLVKDHEAFSDRKDKMIREARFEIAKAKNMSWWEFRKWRNK